MRSKYGNGQCGVVRFQIWLNDSQLTAVRDQFKNAGCGFSYGYLTMDMAEGSTIECTFWCYCSDQAMKYLYSNINNANKLYGPYNVSASNYYTKAEANNLLNAKVATTTCNSLHSTVNNTLTNLQNQLNNRISVSGVTSTCKTIAVGNYKTSWNTTMYLPQTFYTGRESTFIIEQMYADVCTDSNGKPYASFSIGGVNSKGEFKHAFFFSDSFTSS